MNPEFHHFDEDEISAELSLLKVFLAFRLIHRFTSPFQLRQLQYSMVLQLAAAKRKKGPHASELLAMPIAHIRVRYVIPWYPHMIIRISLANLFSCNLFQF